MLNIIIHLLVIGCLSIQISNADTEAEIIKEDLEGFFNSGRTDFANDPNLQFEEDACLGGGGNAIVWRGSYAGTAVAIKVVWNENKMDREIAVLQKLKAMTNQDIEKAGIPRVYYHGEMLDDHSGIAMTLFQGSLHDVYKSTLGRPLSGLDVLQVFKQAVQTLKFLNKKNVMHHDIKPENVFLRGNKVFLGDYDLASTDGTDTWGGTWRFGSARFHGDIQRVPMDDLESLIYSMWYVSGIKLGETKLVGSNLSEGQVKRQLSGNKYFARVQKKLTKYTDPHVQEAMAYVCFSEWLSGNDVPNYDAIIQQLNDAIDNLGGRRTFEWVGQSSRG